MAFDETYRTYIITQYHRVTTFYHPDDVVLDLRDVFFPNNQLLQMFVAKNHKTGFQAAIKTGFTVLNNLLIIWFFDKSQIENSNADVVAYKPLVRFYVVLNVSTSTSMPLQQNRRMFSIYYCVFEMKVCGAPMTETTHWAKSSV
jgi:hypothetical protein